MAPDPDPDPDADARSEETQLVAGLVSAVRSHGAGQLDRDEIDAALGVTHGGEDGDHDGDD